MVVIYFLKVEKLGIVRVKAPEGSSKFWYPEQMSEILQILPVFTVFCSVFGKYGGLSRGDEHSILELCPYHQSHYFTHTPIKVSTNFPASTATSSGAGTHPVCGDSSAWCCPPPTPSRARHQSLSTSTRSFKNLLGHVETLDFFRCPRLLQPLLKMTCGDELLRPAHLQQQSRDQTVR